MDHGGEALKSWGIKTGEKSVALRFMRKAPKRHSRAEAFIPVQASFRAG